MQAIQRLSRRSIDQLETDLISLSQHINASEYEFLVMLREFDIRQGWKPYLLSSCAEWLNLKCGVSPTTAREKLRVARALFDLPQTSASFQTGDLSYSKARSLTRVATPKTEGELLHYALRATAHQVQNHCLQLRHAQRVLSNADVNRLHQNRYMCKNEHLDGSVTISVELPKESADLVMKALELTLSQMELSNEDEGTLGETLPDEDNASRDAFQRQQADALVHMAKGFLSGSKNSSTADHYQVVGHAAAVAVDEKALRGEAACTCERPAKSDLPIETVRRLCCYSGVIPVTEDEQGNPLNVGRKHRMVQPALRRALVSRDKCCRFPGCTHEKWLDAHHVKHWADGGETSLNNTMLLCSKHHRLLHEGGFRINKNPSGEWQFATR